MDIYWYGQACFKIKGKTTTVVIDPFDPDFTGLKLPKDLEAQIVLSTHDHEDHNFVSSVAGNPLIIKGAGEYEKLGVSINGINSYHDKTNGSDRGNNTIYHILMDNINIVHLGDLGHELSDEMVSEIGATDILMIPVGGKATINAETATKVIAMLEPKIIIPIHYFLPGLKFELNPVEDFLKEMGTEKVEPLSKLIISRDKLPDETTVVLLNKI